jgi:hypothetical protein
MRRCLLIPIVLLLLSCTSMPTVEMGTGGTGVVINVHYNKPIGEENGH